MELDAKTISLLVLFFGVLIGFLWDLSGLSDDDFDDQFKDRDEFGNFWEDVDWKDDDIDEEDDRPQSGKK